MFADDDPRRPAIVGAHARSAPVAAAWRRSDEVRALAEVFDAACATDVDRACECGVALLSDATLVARLLTPLVETLAEDPFFEPPFKVQRDRHRIGAALFDSPAARLTAAVTRPGAAAPDTVVVPGQISVTRYHRAGGVTLSRWDAGTVARDFTAAGASPATRLSALAPRQGEVVVHDGRRIGHRAAGATGAVVTVTVLLRAGMAPLMREYRTDGGALVRAASTDDAASRGAMLRTLLRVSGRSDANPLFEAATRDAGFDTRWAAMREWLALDAAAALPRLASMSAADPHPDVRAAAAATLAVATLAVARQRLPEVACPA